MCTVRFHILYHMTCVVFCVCLLPLKISVFQFNRLCSLKKLGDYFLTLGPQVSSLLMKGFKFVNEGGRGLTGDRVDLR